MTTDLRHPRLAAWLYRHQVMRPYLRIRNTLVRWSR